MIARFLPLRGYKPTNKWIQELSNVEATSNLSKPNNIQTMFESLVQENAPTVYALSFAIIANEKAAKFILAEVFADIQHRYLQKNEDFSSFGIYDLTIRRSLKHARQNKITPSAPHGEIKSDIRIWSFLLDRGWKERLLVIAHYGLHWSDETIAQLLHIDVHSAQRDLTNLKRLMGENLTSLPDNISSGSMEEMVSASIKEYISPPIFSAQELSDLTFKSDEISRQNQTWIKPSFPIWARILIVLSILTIGIWLAANRLNVWQISQDSEQSTGSTPLVTNTLSATTTNKHNSPLRWYASSNTIKKRLQESAGLWKTIFMDIQMMDYGPPGYIGAPRIYRAQVWVAQPDQSIQLLGLLHQTPSSVYMHANGRNFYLNPIIGDSYSNPGIASPVFLVEKSDIRQMIFPEISRWLKTDGILRVYNSESVAGLSALVVDYFNPYGQRETRLWLHPQTGIVLRFQEYGGPDLKQLLSDYLVTRLNLDQNFPPADLITSIRDVGSTATKSTTPAKQVILPTPTAASLLDKRASFPPEPAPINFDRATATLSFQFANNLETSNMITGTSSIPIRLFADRFFLADTVFGLPWMLRCNRSADGYRIAFNTGTDGSSVPDDILRWLDLREPQEVYRPLPGIHVDEFAFSKDGSHIAVLGRAKSSDLFTILVLDVATGESREILSLQEGHSLVWSPDEETLAIIGVLENSSAQEAIQVHIRSGQIAFRALMPTVYENLPENWPMANWGRVFPTRMGSLEKCVIPNSP
jgi:hypothetical protein